MPSGRPNWYETVSQKGDILQNQDSGRKVVTPYIASTYGALTTLASTMRIPIIMTTLSFSREAAGKINRLGFALLVAGTLVAGSGVSAQFPTGFPSRAPQLPQKQWKPVVPPEYRPPSGMCRIWIEGVQPSQQPAPTDCVTAVRNRPVNGSVIFGDTPKRDDDKPKKGKSKKDADSSSDS